MELGGEFKTGTANMRKNHGFRTRFAVLSVGGDAYISWPLGGHGRSTCGPIALGNVLNRKDPSGVIHHADTEEAESSAFFVTSIEQSLGTVVKLCSCIVQNTALQTSACIMCL
ncbi:hypothetical protein FVEG_14683 [Fusarium verticillioides 7600]|uniref:Uncharacterized protein n=1 Tax=Gibberella moniliformis (strain M3125 / FGSC 7600) TaxID=334819 RepID=W7LM59_GIBM7|nr:hypothetical protein FVEG_14683 [Fusarium verticillioides 7600]EWG36504.1 hypothetical protein FVEG_14683 [Fusarium verticillioides 7600]